MANHRRPRSGLRFVEPARRRRRLGSRQDIAERSQDRHRVPSELIEWERRGQLRFEHEERVA
jgi:hypothetical protein